MTSRDPDTPFTYEERYRYVLELEKLMRGRQLKPETDDWRHRVEAFLSGTEQYEGPVELLPMGLYERQSTRPIPPDGLVREPVVLAFYPDCRGLGRPKSGNPTPRCQAQAPPHSPPVDTDHPLETQAKG